MSSDGQKSQSSPGNQNLQNQDPQNRDPENFNAHVKVRMNANKADAMVSSENMVLANYEQFCMVSHLEL